MGRRKGEWTILMEVASKWPWKVSAASVPTSYVVCHLIAAAFAHTAAPAADLAGLGPAVIRQGIHAFATSVCLSHLCVRDGCVVREAFALDNAI
jgi:hypothetical protein